MKRLALILFLAGSACVFGAPDPVGDLMKQAQAAATAHNYDEALHLYEQIITEHPEAVDRWCTAQQGIATTLATKGDLAEAAKAAHVCLDAASSYQAFDSAVVLTANILSALDKNVDRANQFLNFQTSGTVAAGANPMDAIGYPSQPAREQVMETLRKQAGDNAMASRLRAFTFLCTGKPKDALAQFADAFRRSSAGSDLERSGTDLAMVGLRAARGHRVGLDKAMQFVLYGPNGPDGKTHTDDDVADPFIDYIPAAPTPGEGGLAGLSADDLAALRQVRDSAALYAVDSRLRRDIRHAALLAMQRCNDALDNWGGKDQKEWYLQLAYAAKENEVNAPCYTAALTAARERSLNFGGMYSLWTEIDAFIAAHDTKIDGGHRDFKFVIAAFTRVKLPAPAFKPLKTPVSFEPKTK